MIAFEVHINGKKRCIAGSEELSSLMAHLAWRDRTDGRVEMDLLIGGLTGDWNQPHDTLEWVAETLTVDDEISIRIMKTETADVPRKLTKNT